MFQVIQPERALYIQANNCVEAKAWIDILTKLVHEQTREDARAAVRDSVVGPAAPSEGAWKQACWTLFLFVSWSVVGHSLEGTLATPW
ncbi:hypothetical protein E2I00_015017 [Balaenoptera physalus]|uniref:PH domain-containing protein n=1 Tax=Balaenoptera physalus TaxID=9770 RepID=A0A6A1Q6I2_BALPH|nr:hypothetical protein E2I00_015017 [Balaenoptera physalus]